MPGGKTAIIGSPWARLGVVLTIAVLVALGVWQIERRAWKLDLIARVDARIQAAPIDAPGPMAWARLTAEQDEYRKLRVTGRFLPGPDTYVLAVTELGPGFWVLTPFRSDDGFTVLVNRGFVPRDHRDAASRPTNEAAAVITGLLRLTEPKGGFLRTNDPAHARWYSRDVAAIAASEGLSGVAPYFIDAAAGADTDGWPRGGLTVIRFPNNHLVYAITWFALALMLGGAAVFVARADRRGG